MSVAAGLFWVAFAFLSSQAAVVLLNLVSFPRLDRLPRPPSTAQRRRRRVSLLIPARNEVHALPATLPGYLGQGADEVVVLDDQSNDGTSELLAATPGLRVISGRPLPEGWSGKNWACHQLSEVATGDVLIFTDADVRWSPGALDAILSEMERRGAGLLTAWTRQHCGTLGERLIVPLIDMVLLANLPYPLVRLLPFASLSGGSGAMMAWTRSAYQRVGGHAADPLQVLDDVQMARRAKAQRVGLALALSGPLLQTRMYRSYPEVVAGFSKNIKAAAGGSGVVLVVVWLLNVLAYTAPWLMASLDARWLGLAVAGVVLRAAVNLKSSRSPWEAWLQPLAPLALAPIVLRALRQGRGYAWKGRVYP